MAGVTVAEAFISLRPDFSGFSAEVDQKLSAQAQAAGVKAGQALNNGLASQANKSSSGLAAFGKQLNSFGSNARTAGTALTAGVTLPIVGLGVAALKSSIDFETAFSGVAKTVDATDAQLATLRQGIRDMAKDMPASAVAIAAVAEAAGQLGIQTPNVLAFTRTMIELGTATNLTADQAATGLAQFNNIIQGSQDTFDELGSTIVDLGNKGASTESQILEMGLRIAGAGHQVGLTAPQILGFAAALANVGIDAEAGGSAISRLFINIDQAVHKGGEKLELFAKVAGVSVEQFQKLFGQDAAKATELFVEGLGRIGDAGGDTFGILDELGLDEIRLRDATLRLAGGGTVLADALGVAGAAYTKNTALTDEYAKKEATTASQLQEVKNRVNDVFISLGDELAPTLLEVVKNSEPLINAFARAVEIFGNLPAPVQQTVLVLAGIAAVAGPALFAIGGIATGISALIALAPIASGALGLIGAALLTPPVGIVVALVAAGIAAYIFRDQIGDAFGEAAEAVGDASSDIGDGVEKGLGKAKDFISGNWREIGTVIAAPFALPAALALNGFGIRDNLISAFGSAKDGAVQKIAGLVNFVEGIPGNIKGALGDLSNLLFEAGKDVLEGFWDGLKSVGPSIFHWLENFTSQIPIHKGPPGTDSQLLFPAGALIIHGLAAGMESGENEVFDFLDVLTGKIGQLGQDLDAAHGPVDAFAGSMDGMTTSLAAAADQHNIDAINAIGGPDAVANYQAAQGAVDALGQEYEQLGGQIDAAETSLSNLSDQITAQQTLVDGLKDKLDAAKTSFSDFSHADILEAQPFDEQSKALKRQREALQLQINQLKLSGPLTKTQDVIDPKTGKKTGTKTLDTDIGKQVKALETQLGQLDLQAQNVNLEKDLQIGPLQDQIDALTDSSKAIPFADIITGLQNSKAEVDSLTPEYATQVGVLDNLKGQYDDQSEALRGLKQTYQDIGDQMSGLQGSIESLVGTAVTQFDTMIAEMQAAATAADAATPTADAVVQSVADSLDFGTPTVVAAGENLVSATNTAIGNAWVSGVEGFKGQVGTITNGMAGVFDASTLPDTGINLVSRTTAAVQNQIAANAPGTYSSWDVYLANVRSVFDNDPLPVNAANLVTATTNSAILTLGSHIADFFQAGKSATTSLANGITEGGIDAQTALNTVITNLTTAAQNAAAGVTTAVGNIGTVFGNALHPQHRAGGGDVEPGQLYWVGEQGPELAIFKQPGSILPNDVVRRLGQMPYQHPVKAHGDGSRSDHYAGSPPPRRRGQQIPSDGLKVEFSGPLVINNQGTQKTAKQAADDFLFHLAAGFRRAGWPVSA